jgi:hypothetical protein
MEWGDDPVERRRSNHVKGDHLSLQTVYLVLFPVCRGCARFGVSSFVFRCIFGGVSGAFICIRAVTVSSARVSTALRR